MNKICCLRVSTAAVIIGWFGVVTSLLAALVFGICLTHLDELTSVLVGGDVNADVNAMRKGLVFLTIFYLAVNLINFLASALLIWGAVRNRHLVLIPWLITYGVSMCFSIVYYFYFAISSFMSNAPIVSTITSLITGAVSVAFQTTAWFVVYSLYKNIKSGALEMHKLISGSSSTIFSRC